MKRSKWIKTGAAALAVVLIGSGVAGTVYAGNGDLTAPAAPAAEEVTLDASDDVPRAEQGEDLAEGSVYVFADASGNVQKLTAMDAQSGELKDHEASEAKLPVSLSIKYFLDGREISEKELEGKSGRLTMRFEYSNLTEKTVQVGGKDKSVHVPFAVVTGLLLGNENFSNISVKNAKIINDGSRTAVVGLVFPGLQKDSGIDSSKLEFPESFELSADVKDFAPVMTLSVASCEPFSKLGDKDFSSLDSLTESAGELSDAMEELLDGSGKLYDGLCTLLEESSKLTDGADQLADGALQLKNGTDTLSGGAGQVKSGAAQLAGGLKTLDENSAALNSGAKQVFETLLATAAEQLKAAGLDVPELTTENYSKVLDNIIASLDDNAVYSKALGTVTKAVEEKRSYIEQQVTAAVKAEAEKAVTEAVQAQVKEKVEEAVRAEVEAKVSETVKQNVRAQVIQSAAGMDAQSYDSAAAAGQIDGQIQAAVDAEVETQMQSGEVKQLIEVQTDTQMGTEEGKALIAQNTEAQMASEEVKTLIAQNTENQMASKEVKALIAQNTEAQVQKAITDNMAGEEVQAQLAKASEGAKKVIALKTSLDSYNSFYQGLETYTAGVGEAAKGAETLSSGAAQLAEGADALKEGAGELYSGTKALKDSTPALIDGITQLRDGAGELNSGLDEFNTKGIQKLVDAVEGDIKGLVDNADALKEAAKLYAQQTEDSQDPLAATRYVIKTN